MGRQQTIREIAMVYVAVCLVTVSLTNLRVLAFAKSYVHFFVGLLFLGAAIMLAKRHEAGVARYGLQMGGFFEPPADDAPDDFLGLAELIHTGKKALPLALHEMGFAFVVALVIFPPFTVAFYFWNHPAHPFIWRMPPDLAGFTLTQLLIVALPEEAFFRGYLHTELDSVFRKRVRFLGADISVAALIIQAILFAVIHVVVDLDPVRFAVFFPGLLFGWLRNLRGGIGAALTMHALSNIFADYLIRGWL